MTDKYAIIKIGSTQFKVIEGYVFEMERQEALNIDVLFYTDGKDTFVGTPYLSDVAVKATLLGEKRAKKVIIARYRAKSRHRRKKGHRQPLSIIEINSITKKGEKAVKIKKTTEKAKKVVKKVNTKKASAKKTSSKVLNKEGSKS